MDMGREEDRWSLEQARRIDAACRRYEAAWRASSRPRIEDHLDRVPEPERSALLVELLPLELELRQRQGERPSPREYQERFPEHAALISTVFDQAAPLRDQGRLPPERTIPEMPRASSGLDV